MSFELWDKQYQRFCLLPPAERCRISNLYEAERKLTKHNSGDYFAECAVIMQRLLDGYHEDHYEPLLGDGADQYEETMKAQEILESL